MSISTGPKLNTTGLVFFLDVSNPNCINASSCVGYNNAPQLVKNLVSQADIISSTTTLRLGNLSYFTSYAIDYPETSFGGAVAGMEGVTPGYNVTSGSKIFDFGRSLHLWIYDSTTSTQVLAQVYDSYALSSEVDRFVTEFNNAKNRYRGDQYTYLVAGSHRDSNHSQAEYDILLDMGAPINVSSIINFASPEWILVGRPGIGPGKGAWSFQNYSTNPNEVAHMNFGVPFKGNASNYLAFNGTDSISGTVDPANYISSNSIDRSWEVIVRPTVSTSTAGLFGHVVGAGCTYYCNGGVCIWSGNYAFNWYDNASYQFLDSGIPATANQYVHIVGTWSSSDNKPRIYVNGVLRNTFSSATNLNYGGNAYYYQMGYLSASGNYFTGNMSVAKYYYNKALTATEVQENFNALRSRYAI
jgi:hypothetical protein